MKNIHTKSSPHPFLVLMCKNISILFYCNFFLFHSLYPFSIVTRGETPSLLLIDPPRFSSWLIYTYLDQLILPPLFSFPSFCPLCPSHYRLSFLFFSFLFHPSLNSPSFPASSGSSSTFSAHQLTLLSSHPPPSSSSLLLRRCTTFLLSLYYSCFSFYFLSLLFPSTIFFPSISPPTTRVLSPFFYPRPPRQVFCYHPFCTTIFFLRFLVHPFSWLSRC